MDNNLLTLDEYGIKSNNEEKLVRILKYFLYNEQARSHFFNQKVKSFKYIVSNYKTDDEVIEALNEQLEELLLRYYNEVDVNITKVESDSKFSYLFNLTVKSELIETKLHQEVRMIDDRLQPLRDHYKGL